MGYSDLKIENKSNIHYGNKKISGSAGRLRLNCVLYHATLLHSVDLVHLENSLLAKESHPINKRHSRYFQTTNLPAFSYDDFKEKLIQTISTQLSLHIRSDQLFPAEMKFAKFLKENLYTTDEWIYRGKSFSASIEDFT